MTTLNIVLNASPTEEPLPGTVALHGRGLRISRLSDAPGLRLAGDLDRNAVTALTTALASIGGDRDILVDLTDLEFIDVGGLRVLVITAAAMPQGRVVRLRSAPSRVRRLLELTGWHHAPGLHLTAPAPAPALTLTPLRRLRQLVAFRRPARPT